MKISTTVLPLGATLLLGGCLEQVWGDLEPWLDTASSGGSTSSTSWTVETTTDAAPTGGVQTVTSATTSPGPDPVDTTSTTTGDPEGPPPTAALSLEPAELTKPGPSSAKFEVGETVMSAILYLGGQIVAQGPPDSLAYTFEATSAALNGEYNFELLALDGKGGSVNVPAMLKVELPAHGTVRCTFQDKGVPVQSGVSSVVWADDYLAALGLRDEGAGPRLALWGIDPVTCNQLWLRTIDLWTLLPITNVPSSGAALALDENGNLVIAGNVAQGGIRPYVALLRGDDRSLIWETAGDLGDQAAGVVRVRWPYEHIIMVGSRLTNANPPRYDALVKGYTTTGVIWEDVLKAPFTPDEINKDIPNDRSEHAFAVAVHPDTLEVIVVGEREFRPDELDPNYFTRTFTARYYPMGGRIGSWTSSGDYMPNDSARSLRRCGDGFIAGGWTNDSQPGSTRWPLARWFDAQGVSAGRHSEPLADTETAGADCDREGKVVNASTRTVGNQTDVVLHASLLPKDPPVWQAAYAGQGMGDDRAATLSCDEWGYCAWGGYERADGMNRAIVQIHYP